MNLKLTPTKLPSLAETSMHKYFNGQSIGKLDTVWGIENIHARQFSISSIIQESISARQPVEG